MGFIEITKNPICRNHWIIIFLYNGKTRMRFTILSEALDWTWENYSTRLKSEDLSWEWLDTTAHEWWSKCEKLLEPNWRHLGKMSGFNCFQWIVTEIPDRKYLYCYFVDAQIPIPRESHVWYDSFQWELNRYSHPSKNI